MTAILSGILIAFFAACGLVALLYCVAAALFADNQEPTLLLLVADEGSCNMELRLKSAKLKLAALPGKEERFIIVLDNGMSAGEREIVGKEARDSANILILQANELKKLS